MAFIITLMYRSVETTIKILYTISMCGEVQQFRAEGNGKNYKVPIPNCLHGSGVLFLSKDRAYFQEIHIDTLVSLFSFVVVVVLLQLQCNGSYVSCIYIFCS